MTYKDILFIVPARKGSKGLPRKNTRDFFGKPLIQYSFEFALKNMSKDDFLCVSSDDEDVLKLANKLGIETPFVRPSILASDTSTTSDVISHALNYFRKMEGIEFGSVCLLQPTSPFRTTEDFSGVVNLFSRGDCDMVVSVKKIKDSPYFNLFKIKENDQFLEPLMDNNSYTRRQDCPEVFAYNGSIYLFDVRAFEKRNSLKFDKVRMFEMPEERSIDIDTYHDWKLAEFYFKSNT